MGGLSAKQIFLAANIVVHVDSCEIEENCKYQVFYAFVLYDDALNHQSITHSK